MIKLALLIPFLLLPALPPRIIEVHNSPAEKPFTLIVAEVTGYSSEEDQTDDTPHLTAAQTAVRDGVIACPRHIPFFTIVEIEGKQYSCEDRMNLKYPDRWDIWFSSEVEALEFGIKKQLIKKYD